MSFVCERPGFFPNVIWYLLLAECPDAPPVNMIASGKIWKQIPDIMPSVQETKVKGVNTDFLEQLC